MKKIKFRDIAYLDALNLTAEKAATIDSIVDCTAILTTESALPFLNTIRMEDIASIIAVPDETKANVMRMNGSMLLDGGALSGGQVYLIINGELIVSPSVSAEDLRQNVIGGKINGVLICSDVQLSALQSAGITLNGTTQSYPQDCRLRQGKEAIGEAEVTLLSPGEKLYLLRKVPLEKGCARKLAEKQVQLYGNKGMYAPAGEAAQVAEVWHGDSSKVEWIPEGFTLSKGNQRVNKRNARALRGKLYMTGNLVFDADLSEGELSGLQGVWTEKQAWIPAHLADVLLPLFQGAPEYLIYEGNLLINEGELRLTTDAVSQWPKAVTLINRGSMEIDDDLSPTLLRDSIVLLQNNGVITLSEGQRGALLPVLEDHGHIQNAAEPEITDPMEDDPDFVIISDVAHYML